MNRLALVKKLLITNKLDEVLVSAVSNIFYLTSFSNFSKDEREAYLLITKNDQYIFTDARYSEAIKKQVKDFTLIEISGKNSFEKMLTSFAKKHKIKKIGFEENNITIAESKRLYPCINTWIREDVSKLRMVKDENEIAAIEKACKLGDDTFNYVLTKIKAGISEKELAFALEFFIKKHGADISFKSIVAFGKNASVPHHETGNSKLKIGDIVLLDFGAKVNGYCSDMTRTVFFGKANDEQKKMYETVLESQQRAIEQCNNLAMKKPRNKMKACEIDKVAREYIVSQGYPSIPHSLGHGIGIDVHEEPRLSPHSKQNLQTNMVFSIEPGIYVPNFGGIRIEDIAVLTKSGLKLLTKSPKQLIEL